jgi:hypothetical protein
MSWSEPKRTRRSVHRGTIHLGYVTVVSYPDRDLMFLPEGTPFSEVVIADTAENHVALLQRFKAHWLIQCGEHYGTADVAGELSESQIMDLALDVLSDAERGEELVDALEAQLKRFVTPRKPGH